jgi:CBS domain-containing protein
MKQQEMVCTNRTPRAGDVSTAQERLVNFIEFQTSSVMTKNVLTITKEMTLRELEHLFELHDFNSFPVVEDGYLIGIASKFDFLKNFIFTPSSVFPHYDDLMKRPVGQIMTREVRTVRPTTPLTRVLQMMVDLKAQSLPVVDDQNHVLGIISRGDMIAALNG